MNDIINRGISGVEAGHRALRDTWCRNFAAGKVRQLLLLFYFIL
jgi:hypothetical protein